MIKRHVAACSTGDSKHRASEKEYTRIRLPIVPVPDLILKEVLPEANANEIERNDHPIRGFGIVITTVSATR